jgi:hypothetical protein
MSTKIKHCEHCTAGMATQVCDGCGATSPPFGPGWLSMQILTPGFEWHRKPVDGVPPPPGTVDFNREFCPGCAEKLRSICLGNSGAEPRRAVPTGGTAHEAWKNG